jgi:hypothetical protein
MHKKTVASIEAARQFERAARCLRDYAAADERSILHVKEARKAAASGSKKLERIDEHTKRVRRQLGRRD